MNIISTTVLYKPSENIVDRLRSYMNQVDTMLIIDNSENPDRNLHDLIKNKISNSLFIINKENLGIARALNQGLEYALENGYQYALLMDQDSEMYPDTVQKLLSCMENNSSAYITAPIRKDVNTTAKPASQTTCAGILACATSGSLVRVKYLPEIGYHDEKLFIDMVDHEYCLRSNARGFRVFLAGAALMRHRLGNMQERRLLGIKLFPTYHSALRWHYRSRNCLFVWKKYFFRYPRYVIPGVVNFLIEYIEILLFEKDKFKKTAAIIRGFRDFFRSKYGRIDTDA